MSRRTTLTHTLTAALAASAIAASPAVSKPMDPINEAGLKTSSLAGTTSPTQDLRSPDARDAERTQVAPGQPTWPVDPQPLQRPATPAPAPADGDGDSIWLVLGIGIAGAGLVAGGAAGLARHTRVRARRVAA